MLPELRFMGESERGEQLVMVIKDTLAEEPDEIANLATVTSYIYAYITRLNWVGFYILRGETLIVGPYQGLPACVRIPLGKGVCGTAAAEKRVIVVPEVSKFAGHISCDSASRAEIVIPVYKDGELYGVLDIDSPEPDRFAADDVAVLTEVGQLVSEAISKKLVTV
jgi:GAF domain-containing protein